MGAWKSVQGKIAVKYWLPYKKKKKKKKKKLTQRIPWAAALPILVTALIAAAIKCKFT